MMNNKVNVLCTTCIHHGTFGKVDVCTHTAPNWEVRYDVFVCHDYVEIKETENNEKKKL